ncbi:MAG: type II toxin-antitoxin system RelE/ParE family toxin [Treponema sp.]|nr:type II toxin-antitoxin system RelE/ParE family toxin [Treponema sp.]
MRTFKNQWFARFADKEGVSDEELKAVVGALEEGRFDADLGGGVYKQRLARSGGGKSGGYRAIVFFRSGERTFFHYGFAKSDRSNVSGKELKWYKEVAKYYLALTHKQILLAIETGELIEV